MRLQNTFGRKTTANITTNQPVDNHFLAAINAWKQNNVQKAKIEFAKALQSDALTATKLQDMGDFFTMKTNDHQKTILCFERAISECIREKQPVSNALRLKLASAFYVKWQSQCCKDANLLREAGDQIFKAIQNNYPVEKVQDLQVFAEPSFPYLQQSAEVGLRLAKTSHNRKLTDNIFAHTVAKLSTHYTMPISGVPGYAHTVVTYKPEFSTLSKEVKEQIGLYLYHRTYTDMWDSDLCHQLLHAIPKNEIPETAAKIEARNARLTANRPENKIISKYIASYRVVA